MGGASVRRPLPLADVDRSAAWDSSFDELLFLAGASQRQESPPSGRRPASVSASSPIWAGASAGAADLVTTGVEAR